MANFNIGKIQLINLPKIDDNRGNLSFIEEFIHLPFKIQRVYWIYDVPGGQQRGGHAFKLQSELIIALSGSFEVYVDNGYINEKYILNRSYFGLYIPSKVWRHMENFSTNSVALVLSSTNYNPDDYIYDYQKYLDYVRQRK